MARRRLEQIEFAENPEPRCAVILLLDTSGSMQGDRIAQLNEGLQELDRALKADRLASLRVELAVIAFGGSVQVLEAWEEGGRTVAFDARQVFTTVDHFRPPTLEARGETPMGEAVHRAIALLRDRKEIYKQNGVDYFRPWIFLITDGRPTDLEWESAAARIKEEQACKALFLYAVGVEGADLQTLARFSGECEPLNLKGLAFRELFQWLSKSLSAVAHSRPGVQVPLPPVDGLTDVSRPS